MLSLKRPDVIRDIREGYLAAGADLIETTTFGATTVALAAQVSTSMCIFMCARLTVCLSKRRARATLLPALTPIPTL